MIKFALLTSLIVIISLDFGFEEENLLLTKNEVIKTFSNRDDYHFIRRDDPKEKTSVYLYQKNAKYLYDKSLGGVFAVSFVFTNDTCVSVRKLIENSYFDDYEAYLYSIGAKEEKPYIWISERYNTAYVISQHNEKSFAVDIYDTQKFNE